jgi:hypothetical protein
MGAIDRDPLAECGRTSADAHANSKRTQIPTRMAFVGMRRSRIPKLGIRWKSSSTKQLRDWLGVRDDFRNWLIRAA